MESVQFARDYVLFADSLISRLCSCYQRVGAWLEAVVMFVMSVCFLIK